jgi:hypothetical protein
MSCYPVAQEITSICADYLVELRGFEPLTSAVQAPARVTGSSLLFQAARRRRRRLERLVGLYENRGFACGGLISAQVPMDPLANNIGGASVRSCDLRLA